MIDLAKMLSRLAPPAMVLLIASGGLSLSAQSVAQGDLRQVMTIAADSVATRLRAVGRAHLYVMPEVTCDSLTVCTSEITALARDVFATSAIATPVQHGQRWPTLCDNSDEIRVGVPVIAGDTASVRVVSTHALRRMSAQEGMSHSLTLVKANNRWAVTTYDTATVLAATLDALDAIRCAWSPEAGTAVSRGSGTGMTPRPSAAAIAINTEESCPWCRITSAPRLRLGQPTDLQLPREGTAVWSNGRGRYFTQNSTGTQLLIYDGTGALTTSVGMPGQQPGEFGSIDAVLSDAQDSVFVLDNQRRRIVVLTPTHAFARAVPLPWRVDDFLILRDGRILTVRTPRTEGDPVSIHRATGEIIRSFGAVLGPDGLPCTDCGRAIIAVQPSGYRLWLARGARYQLEEWDLTGRRVAVLENPTKNFGVSADTTRPVGLSRMVTAADGSLWVAYTVMDSLAGPVSAVDVLDPVRARLVKTFVGETLRNVVTDGIRAVHRTDEFGFPEVRLERFQIDRRRQDQAISFGRAPFPAQR